MKTEHSQRGDGMRHDSWILGLLAAFAVATVGLGCSSAPEAKPAGDAAAAPDAPKDAAPVTPPQEPGKIDAQDENWRKIAEEAAKSRTVQQQEQFAQSSAHYDRALEFHRRGDFSRAKEEAQKAVDAWQGNLEARKLLSEVNSLLTGTAQGGGTEQDRLRDE